MKLIDFYMESTTIKSILSNITQVDLSVFTPEPFLYSRGSSIINQSMDSPMTFETYFEINTSERL